MCYVYCVTRFLFKFSLVYILGIFKCQKLTFNYTLRFELKYTKKQQQKTKKKKEHWEFIHTSNMFTMSLHL